MLNKYKDFISEGISFLKRDKYQYNPVYDAMINHVRGYLRRNEIVVDDINNLEYQLAIKKGAIEYMNENLVDKTILIDRGIKIITKYEFISIIGPHGGEFDILTDFEIIFKRSELCPTQRGGELVSIYDKNEIEYVINATTLFAIKIKRKVNRQITAIDPLGEEDWDE